MISIISKNGYLAWNIIIIIPLLNLLLCIQQFIHKLNGIISVFLFHERFVVVLMRFSFLQFVEPTFKFTQWFLNCRIVNQTQTWLLRPQWRILTQPDFKSIVIPPHEFNVFLNAVNIFEHITNVYGSACHQCSRHIQSCFLITRQELEPRVEYIAEYRIYWAWVKFDIHHGVERGKRGAQEMHMWVRHHVHTDFVQVHINWPFEPHRWREIAEHMCHNVIHLVIHPFFVVRFFQVCDWVFHIFLFCWFFNIIYNTIQSLIFYRKYTIREFS